MRALFLARLELSLHVWAWRRRDNAALVALVLVTAILSVWAFVFWPGVAVPDTSIVLREVQSRSFGNWHPETYGVIWAALSSLSGYGWPMLPLQLASLAVAVTALVVRACSNRRAIITSAALLALFPALAVTASTIEKDGLFLSAVLLTTAALIALQRSSSWAWFAVLAVSCLLVGLLRWNGPVMLFMIAIAALAIIPRPRSLVVLVLVGTVAIGSLVVLFRPPFGDNAGGHQITQLGYALDFAYLAARDPGALTSHSSHAMESIAPIGAWAGSAGNCDAAVMPLANGLFSATPDGWERFVSVDWKATWFAQLRASPWVIVDGRLCRSRGILAIADKGLAIRPEAEVASNRLFTTFYVLSVPDLPWEQPMRGNRVLQALRESDVLRYLWSPVIPLVIVVACAFLTRSRRTRHVALAVLSVSLAQITSVFLGATGVELRYLFAATVVLQVFIVCTSVSWLATRMVHRQR